MALRQDITRQGGGSLALTRTDLHPSGEYTRTIELPVKQKVKTYCRRVGLSNVKYTNAMRYL
jgi:hypothetical protein